MSNNFISNDKTKSLKSRINTLIQGSEELKFLVGFFYFSGWKELYQNLKENKDITLKLLVGLQVDKLLGKMIIEHGHSELGISSDDVFINFLQSLGLALNNEEIDTEEFYNQIEFFIEMLVENRLIIRKTQNPNHAKLYIFRYNASKKDWSGAAGQFITGSSNLTRAGLSGQEEFNVEIKDYGFDDTNSYFDELWEEAIPITEYDDRKQDLLNFIKHKSQAAIVTPFEAYLLILKTYVELQQQKKIKPSVERTLEKIGFKKFSYQTDAVSQALTVIEEHDGVIIADVVGLGKSVIASMIAKSIGKRGMVICPPGLIGDKKQSTGWWEYINNFGLNDWEVESRGKIEELAQADESYLEDIEVIIVDEAHSFRNQDTDSYAALFSLCKNKKVILLTATPINNAPMDIYSLLNLFIVPGKSPITLDDNLQARFRGINSRFKKLSYIMKNYQSAKADKQDKSKAYYEEVIGETTEIDIGKVKEATKVLSNNLKSILAPVMIRRNRLDIKSDSQYGSEVGSLSVVKDPEELFYYLSEQQSEFYNRVVSEYFSEEDGAFKGAIYQPYSYEKKLKDGNKLDEEGNRSFQQQRNLYDFMRRMLVKRFESSFGSFVKSIERFTKVHVLVKDFIKNSGGKFILDRKLMEDIYNFDEDTIENHLIEFEQKLLQKNAPKNNKVYNVNKFELKEQFLADIDRDIDLFKSIKLEAEKLELINNDPKREEVLLKVDELIKTSKSNRKVIIFSEFVDTVKHLEDYFKSKMGSRVLICDGKVDKKLANKLNQDFNAQYKKDQTNDFDLLITSDKFSEGFNLNRAGVIINYDIPWNPTRVIQRVGRINRIGMKVFDELRIFNFFPSEIGADLVKSREIASQKMFLIHNSLGEDSKIFDPDEEPLASTLFNKVQQNPEKDEELGIQTIIRNEFFKLSKEYPEVLEKIKNLPARVKTSKSFGKSNINIVRKKGLSLFSQHLDYDNDNMIPKSLSLEELLPFIRSDYQKPRLNLSNQFWEHYRKANLHKPKYKLTTSEASVETKTRENLRRAIKIIGSENEEMLGFTKDLLTDMRNYFTLPISIQRRIAKHKLSQEKDSNFYKFSKELEAVKSLLGIDYLKTVVKKVENQTVEVIIAVENQRK